MRKKVIYSGIILSDESRSRLVRALQSYIDPLLAVGWQMVNRPPPGVPPEELPHHMTICLGPLPPDMSLLAGTFHELFAVAWGQSELAAAVQVRTQVRSNNRVPHITVAVAPAGKPFHSNEITNWVNLGNEIPLIGVVTEVG